MKRTTGLVSTVTVIAVVSFTLLTTSCSKLSPRLQPPPDTRASQSANTAENTGAPLKVDGIHVYLFVEDANKKPPVGDATLLFDTRGHTPVLAPDGHQITLGEYNQFSGWADIKCVGVGTHVVVHAQGLIPNGVYTFWVLTFKSPGFNGTMVNLIGNGALGAPDGSENAVVASADGTASLSVIMPAESLSLFGKVGSCFASEFEVHVVAAYHSDGLTHGSSPGDPTTWVVQFGYPFHGSQL